MGITANQFNELLQTIPPKILNIPKNKLSEKPSPDKWSKKEILGHLCDSAFNNISRVIRSQYEELPLPIVPYNQHYWINLNGYQNIPVEEILNLWIMLNHRLIGIIESIPKDRLNNMCVLEDGKLISIGRLMEEDYLKHMEHHL